jgi:ABC-2 type transport system permease protein
VTAAPSLRRLVAGELHKLATTRLWLWLLVASIALTALFAGLDIAFADSPDTTSPPLDTPDGQRTLFSVGYGGAAALVAVLAAVGLTGEYRHRTATATFLATPHRGRVVAAKLAAYPLVGAGYAAVCIGVTAAIALPWLAARGISVPLTGNGIPATLAGVLAAVALYALLGVGLGALLRDQVATVVSLLLYLFLAEPVLTRIPALHHWTAYLPGPAANALTGITLTDRDFLTPWQGGLLLAGYGTALATAGALLTIRRDIT